MCNVISYNNKILSAAKKENHYKGMVNHTDIQYEEGDICERTDPPYDQGCLGRGSAEFKQQ